MRTRNSPTRMAFLVGGALAFAGCDSPGTGTPPGSSASALAVAVAGQGSGSAHLRVTAISDISGQAEAVEHLAVQGGSTAQVVFELTPASYTLALATFADAAEQVRIGEGKASAQVSANATAVVNLKVDVDRPAGGGGTITVDAHAAPVIAGIAVKGGGAAGLDGAIHLDGSGNASGKLEGSAEVTVRIDARAEGGGSLHFFWSGAGLQGSLEGSSSLTVSAQATAMLGVTTRVIHVVVQDDYGAAAALRIELDSTALGGFTSFHASNQAAAGADTKVSACLNAHASCVVACSAAASANNSSAEARLSCLAGCGVELAGCESR